MEESVTQCKADMEKRIKALDNELMKVRTGRASVSIFDNVKVDYYGAPTPLNQVAALATPDARTIVITPFEKKALGDIERAIHMADLGYQPNNDGNVIRVPIPPLTEDRRIEIAKSIKKIGEDAKVNIRKVRQDANNKIKKMVKSKDCSEDDSKGLQKDIQTETDSYVKVVDARIATKEKEILSM